MKSNRNNRAPAPAAAARPHMSVAKKLMVISLCTLATVMAVLSAAIGYAYFTKEEVYDAYFGIQVGELFDKLEPEALEDYQTRVLGGSANSSAVWGTKENPYVISKSKHLYNLSQLQNVGYFERQYIASNYDQNGNYIARSDNMPYFLVCDKEGNPVCIEGGDEKIKPIGTEEYPFIGSINGAFGTTPCTIPNGTEAGLKSDISALHNIQIASTMDSVDVGLFGHITCLGDPSTANAETGKFQGYISEISNLLLSDVCITVNRDSWGTAVWKAVVDTVDNVLNHHIFSYTGALEDPDINKIPHETHHIGIFAGHVTYSKVEFISIYYSDNDMLAMDLSHVAKNGDDIANYMSGTGIVGFMDGMNPIVDENGDISENTGTGNANLNMGTTGGGGGGSLSGNKRGYIVAQNVLTDYHYTADGGTPGVVTGYENLYDTTLPDYVEQSDYLDSNPIPTPVYIKDLYAAPGTTDAEGNPLTTEELRLCKQDANSDIKLYFFDGVFTFALSKTANDTIQPTWWEYNDDGTPTDNFSIGANNAGDWAVDYTTGAPSILAYIRKVNSDQELAEALTAGKKFFFINENLDNTVTEDKLYLMRLDQTATPSGSDKNTMFYTGGMAKDFASGDVLDEYIANYQNGTWSVPSDMDRYGTAAELAAALGPDGDLRAIYVGAATQTANLTTLRDQFAISGANVKDVSGNVVYEYFNHDTGNAVELNTTTMQIEEYLEYINASYTPAGGTETRVDGYFYCEYNERYLSESSYIYYWQSIVPNEDGTYPGRVQIQMDNTTTTVASFLNGATVYDYHGISLYSKDVNFTTDVEGAAATTRVGAMIWRTNTVFGGDQADVLYNGSSEQKRAIEMEADEILFKTLLGDPIDAFFCELDTNTWYFGSTKLDSAPVLEATGETTPGSLLPYYKAGDNVGVWIDKHPQYEFYHSSTNNYLQLMNLEYDADWLQGRLWTTNYYPLWCGPKNPSINQFIDAAENIFQSDDAPDSISSSSYASVKFTNGSVYIKYTADDQVRYVTYMDAAGDLPKRFTTSTTMPNDANNKLSIYVLEGTQVGTDNSRVTLHPKDENATVYNAGDYVLFANSSEGTADGSPNNTYTLQKLSDLKWNDSKGNMLGTDPARTALHKKFCMEEGIDFNLQINLGQLIPGLNWTVNTSGLITAPVGSQGVNANIPQGCVAYRVNTTVPEAQAHEINIIVAVPVRDTFNGEAGEEVEPIIARYFNIWQSEESGSSFIQISDPGNVWDRFALPMSNPYSADWTLADPSTWDSNENLNYINVNADLDNDGNIDTETTGEGENAVTQNVTYRTYLNGDRVLIAYTFRVWEEGIYIIGASGYDPVSGDDVSVPMEVIYFSTPAAASEGRDGETNAQLGTIDFVYDNGTKVMQVTERSTLFDTDADGNPITDAQGNRISVEDPMRSYYPSYTILYYDSSLHTGTDDSPSYISINEVQVRLRRYIDHASTTATKTSIAYNTVLDADKVTTYKSDYIKFNKYATSADNVKKEDDTPTP